jgi:hypothetical protein
VQHIALRLRQTRSSAWIEGYGIVTGMASMDHSPSPINLLFSVLIKAILDAVP